MAHLTSRLRGHSRQYFAAAFLILSCVLALTSDANAQIALQTIIAGEPTEGLRRAKISSDGTTVIASGLSANGTLDAYLWTRSQGARHFDEIDPTQPVASRFTPLGISGDGSRIVGYADNTPVLWEPGIGTTSLPVHPTGPGTGVAQGISDNGEYVVGFVYGDQMAVGAPPGSIRPQPVPARWSVSTNQLDLLSEQDGFAHAVSDNGIAVGRLRVPPPAIFLEPLNVAFRAAPGSDLQHIPPAPNLGGAQWAFDAIGISADGSTIAGASRGTLEDVSFPYPRLGIIWTGSPGNGETLLPEGITTIVPPRPFGGIPSVDVAAMSSDGTTVVGTATDGSSLFERPFIWSRESGMQDLQVLLASNGVDLGDLTLDYATGVSADGKRIVGVGTVPHQSSPSIRLTSVWLITIPEPNTALLLGLGLASMSLNRRTRPKHP